MIFMVIEGRVFWTFAFGGWCYGLKTRTPPLSSKRGFVSL